jgi:hypothetical protein
MFIPKRIRAKSKENIMKTNTIKIAALWLVSTALVAGGG